MLEAFALYWHGDQDEPQFLLEWRDPDAPRRRRVAVAGALAFQVLVALLALYVPSGGRSPAEGPQVMANLRNATPLVAPRLDQFRLTQKEPQRSKPSAEVDMAALLPRPEVIRTTRPAPRGFVPPAGAPRPAPQAQPVVEAPKIEIAQQGVPSNLPPAPMPQWNAAPPPPDKSKNPFQSVRGPQAPAGAPSGVQARPQIEVPKAGVDDTVRSIARAGAGGRGQVVGDVGSPDGGITEGLSQQAAPGRNASTLELLSDSQGMDFRPYLIQVLASVKRNWQAVMPESARLGRRGRVAIQFIIDKSGRVPKLVIAVPSGADALDRAAVAGISASNPFPPLPSEFRGQEIRLQLVFSYNMPR
jgi:TonB family protein